MGIVVTMRQHGPAVWPKARSGCGCKSWKLRVERWTLETSVENGTFLNQFFMF